MVSMDQEEIQRIDLAFERIRSCFTLNRQQQKLLLILDHVKSCNRVSCCSKAKQEIWMHFIECKAGLEHNKDDLPNVSTLLFFHSLNCKDEPCNVPLCSEFRVTADKFIGSMTLEEEGIVKFSRTCWFDVDTRVRVSVDYQVFCKYFLSSGAQGEVEYQWLHRKNCDAAVATKITHDVSRDIQIAQLGEHPNIVSPQLILSNEFDARNLIFMRKADCTLLQYTEAYKKDMQKDLSDELAVLFMKEILSGLEFLHRNSIIHGDLKGSNIVLTHGMQRLQLIDFGSVRTFTNEPSRPLFTFGYRPPEIFNGCVQIEPCLDMYSFGVVILEMFFGNMEVRRNSKEAEFFPERNRCYENPKYRPSAAEAICMLYDIDHLKAATMERTNVPLVQVRLTEEQATKEVLQSELKKFLVKRLIQYMDKNIAKDLPP